VGAILSAGLWILKGQISGLIHQCVTCRKMRGRLENQKMSDLPADRVSVDPPFTHRAGGLWPPERCDAQEAERREQKVGRHVAVGHLRVTESQRQASSMPSVVSWLLGGQTEAHTLSCRERPINTRSRDQKLLARPRLHLVIHRMGGAWEERGRSLGGAWEEPGRSVGGAREERGRE